MPAADSRSATGRGHSGYTTTRASNAYGLASARPPEPVPPGETDRGRLAGSEGLFDSRGRAANSPPLCALASCAQPRQGHRVLRAPGANPAQIERVRASSAMPTAQVDEPQVVPWLKKDQLAYYGPFRCVSTDIRVDSMGGMPPQKMAREPPRAPPRAPRPEAHRKYRGKEVNAACVQAGEFRLASMRHASHRALEPPPGRGVGTSRGASPPGHCRALRASPKYSVPSSLTCSPLSPLSTSRTQG